MTKLGQTASTQPSAHPTHPTPGVKATDPATDPKIIYEDTHLVVLSKPAGLLSQGEKTGDINLVDWLRDYFGRHYVGLVHRLDRNTSGIMVVAKRTKAAQRLTLALQKGELNRIYRAWLIGTLSQPVRWKHFLKTLIEGKLMGCIV